MHTRRTFLGAAAVALAWDQARAGRRARAGAADGKPVVVRDACVVRLRDRKGGGTESYLTITDESGLTGVAGPLLTEQAAAVPANLRELLAGRDVADPKSVNFSTLWDRLHPGHPLTRYADGIDPLTGATVWGTRRATRHTETGWAITALSAVDLALWDLRGQAARLPVWRLLGGNRRSLPAYASMLGYSVNPAEARKAAREFFDRGFTRQKWFFMSGPIDGAAGLKANIELVRAVREELGPDATLMFDGIQSVWKSVDLEFSLALAKAILPYKPHWLEEPLRPDDLEGYTRLQGETGITLAAGEHWYTRWNVKPFLDRKLVQFVQSDPEWCGGITGWLGVCELVREYPGVQVIPHGHHVLAASSCVASRAESLCPMMEYLIQSRLKFQHCQTRPLLASAGTFALADEPGIGPPLDWDRLERLS
jgi:L-rhamnonate dehydratase